MTKQKIQQSILSIASSVFGVPANLLLNETSPSNRPEWDSMNHLLLLSRVEEAFHITIPIETSIELASLSDFIEFVYKEKNHV